MQDRHKGLATHELVRQCWTNVPTGDGSQYTLGDLDDTAWYFERMPGDADGYEDLRMFGGHDAIFRFESKSEDRDRLLFLLRYVDRLYVASGAEAVYITFAYRAGPNGAASQIRVR
jgi:hypothetical protein